MDQVVEMRPNFDRFNRTFRSCAHRFSKRLTQPQSPDTHSQPPSEDLPLRRGETRPNCVAQRCPRTAATSVATQPLGQFGQRWDLCWFVLVCVGLCGRRHRHVGVSVGGATGATRRCQVRAQRRWHFGVWTWPAEHKRYRGQFSPPPLSVASTTIISARPAGETTGEDHREVHKITSSSTTHVSRGS